MNEDDCGVAQGTQVIRFERLLPGPIERVWAYLTDSEKRGQWLASGVMPVYAGGEFELHFNHRNLSSVPAPTPEPYRKYDKGHVSRHRVTRFEPPHVLAFTWGDEKEGQSEVLIELKQAGERVRLVLTHEKLPDPQQQLGVSGGWHAHLAVLDDRLNERPTPSFWAIFAELEGVYEKRLPKS